MGALIMNYKVVLIYIIYAVLGHRVQNIR